VEKMCYDKESKLLKGVLENRPRLKADIILNAVRHVMTDFCNKWQSPSEIS